MLIKMKLFGSTSKSNSIIGLPEEEFYRYGHRACAGCGESIATRIITKAAGKNTIVVSPTGCLEVVSTPYPETAWRVNWIHSLFENAAAVASGIDSALKMMGKRDDYNLIVIAGDGATFDIGFQALSGAFERGTNFCYICLDNECYANTGVQRSSATPYLASTTTTPAGKLSKGKTEWKKPIAEILAAHGSEFVATATIFYFRDLYSKVKKALSIKGPTFIHVFAPCPTGWRFSNEKTVKVSRLAVETGAFPLYEIEKGVLKLTYKPSLKPIEEYLKIQGRFAHLTEEDIKKIQDYVNKEWERLLKIESLGNIYKTIPFE